MIYDASIARNDDPAISDVRTDSTPRVISFITAV